MAKFIPQYIFNMCAVTAAKTAASSDRTIGEAARLLSNNYERSYADRELHEDIELAGKEVAEFIKSVLPVESFVSNMIQLQYTIVNYEPSGKKRRKKMFGGTWFNKEKSQIPNKVEVCKANIATYHLLLVGGSLPLAPRGWSP